MLQGWKRFNFPKNHLGIKFESRDAMPGCKKIRKNDENSTMRT